MGVSFKIKHRRLLLWVGIPAAVLCAAAVTGLLIFSLLSPSLSQEPGQTPTQAPTDPTEPPIPLNPYGPEDFIQDGNFLTTLAKDTVPGIDISAWQENVDWQQVADYGVKFVFIRVGYRGNTAGGLFTDSLCQTHYAEAKAAGLQIGAYFYSQATTAEEAREEAVYAMDIVKDWEMEMPLVYDWECAGPGTRTETIDPRVLTDCVRAFCGEVTAQGYDTMVYFNPKQARELMLLEELVDIPFWLAMYDTPMEYPYKVHMWQYTSSASIPGIPGRTDVNILFSYPEEEP